MRNTILQKFSRTFSKKLFKFLIKFFGLVKITLRLVHATDFLCTKHLFCCSSGLYISYLGRDTIVVSLGM